MPDLLFRKNAMKKHTAFSVTIGLLFVAFSGFYAGKLYQKFNSASEGVARQSPRNKALERRTEAYRPTCTELRNRNMPALVRKGDDYFFVHATDDSFYVCGINIMPGSRPEFHWWGADTAYELSQHCLND